MRFVLVCQSLVSDVSDGHAHFLRGIVRALRKAGHETDVREQAERGTIDTGAELDGADVVIVHGWNDPEVVQAVGRHRHSHPDPVLLFYDADHRALTVPEEIAQLELDGFDAVLAAGDAVRDVYLERGWAQKAFTWHEAADTDLFRPLPARRLDDLIWVGDWGGDGRDGELIEFLIRPATHLGLHGHAYGARWPLTARQLLCTAGLTYGGRLPNHAVPDVFARHRVTVHIPRRTHAAAVAGIPSIRVFEALACGIPLVCAPWEDSEGLFSPGDDYLLADDGTAMAAALHTLLGDPEAAATLQAHGLQTIRARHTCAHRVVELESIIAELRPIWNWIT